MNEPLFTRQTSAFAMTCRVEVNILATAHVVWRLLTDAKGFPRWNSTVTGISGVMFALTKGMFPDFGPIFEAYAHDLKRESERIARENAGGSGMRGA
jgi:hypothetical protein